MEDILVIHLFLLGLRESVWIIEGLGFFLLENCDLLRELEDLLVVLVLHHVH